MDHCVMLQNIKMIKVYEDYFVPEIRTVDITLVKISECASLFFPYCELF